MDKLIEYLNQSPTIFFILKKNKKWELEYVTENVVDFYGQTAQEFITQEYNHEDFIHEDDLDRFLEETKLVSKTQGSEFCFTPYRIINDNKIIWINHQTKIIKDEEGNRQYYYGYLTNVSEQKELFNELEITKNLLHSMFDNSSNFIFLLDRQSRVLKLNNTAIKGLNLDENRVLGKKLTEYSFWEKEQLEEIKEDLKLVNMGSCIKDRKYYINIKESELYLEVSYNCIFNKKDELIYILLEAHDITSKEKINAQLTNYVKIVNENIYISIANKEGYIIDVSDAYCKFLQYEKSELLGKKHNIFKHPDNDSYIYKELWETITNGRIWKGEHKNIKKDGSSYWVENSITPTMNDKGEITAYTSIYNDITDKKEISKLLITDYLTKIYNRRHFNTTFELELKRNKRDNKNLVLIIIDIDYFKQYNDSYGHDAGDKALHSVAQALKYTLKRSQDFVFRLGGEEFGIITSGIDENGTLILTKKLHESIENLDIKHKESKVSNTLTISMGIKIVSPVSSLSQNDIYKLADFALYEAKEKGRNQAIISSKEFLA